MVKNILTLTCGCSGPRYRSMLLLGHAAVSARRGPRGTCQETRAALWAPAECGVTARSASDGVDANGIWMRHRRLQLRRYQCGMSAKVSPQILLRLRPRIVGADEVRSWSGIPSPSLFRGFAAKPRATLGMDRGFGCCRLLYPCFGGWVLFRSPSLFLLLDEKPLVFAGMHTRPISA